MPLKSAFYQEQHPQANAGGFVCIRNESIFVLAQGSPEEAGRNVIAGVVQRRINMGSYVEYLVAANGHEIAVRAPRSVTIVENNAVDLAFAEENCLYLAN